MEERQEHLGWKLFRIASISMVAPVDAGSDDRNDAYCFIGKIYPEGTDGSIDYHPPRYQGSRMTGLSRSLLPSMRTWWSKAMVPSICTSG